MTQVPPFPIPSPNIFMQGALRFRGCDRQRRLGLAAIRAMIIAYGLAAAHLPVFIGRPHILPPSPYPTFF